MLIYFIQTYLSYTKLSVSNFKPVDHGTKRRGKACYTYGCKMSAFDHSTNQIPTYHSFKVGLKYAKNLGECLVFTAKSAFK